MDVWQQILIALGGEGMLLVVFGVLARSLLQTWLTKDIKKFETDLKASADSQLEHLKYELKARGDKSIEQLKSALQVASVEHQIRFSNLHEKRAEIIAGVYRRLVDVEREGRIYIYTFGKVPKDEQGEVPPLKALREFDIFVDQHRIYLSERICALLAEFSGVFAEPVVFAVVNADSEPLNVETIRDGLQGFKKAIEAFRKDIPAVRRELEREFRGILGVT